MGFQSGRASMFSFSIDVPDEKYNVVDELFEANSELESKLNAQINENIELKNTLIAHQCAEAFVQESSGLADTEIEKLASLAEGIEFSTVAQYREKVKLNIFEIGNQIKFSIFPGSRFSQLSIILFNIIYYLTFHL